MALKIIYPQKSVIGLEKRDCILSKTGEQSYFQFTVGKVGGCRRCRGIT